MFLPYYGMKHSGMIKLHVMTFLELVTVRIEKTLTILLVLVGGNPRETC